MEPPLAYDQVTQRWAGNLPPVEAPEASRITVGANGDLERGVVADLRAVRPEGEEWRESDRLRFAGVGFRGLEGDRACARHSELDRRRARGKLEDEGAASARYAAHSVRW